MIKYPACPIFLYREGDALEHIPGRTNDRHKNAGPEARVRWISCVRAGCATP